MKDIAKALLTQEIQYLEQMIALGPPGVPAALAMVKQQLAEKKTTLAKLEGEDQ